MLQIIDPDKSDMAAVFLRPGMETERLRAQTGAVLLDIKQHGDEALKRYTLELDGVEIDDPVLNKTQLEEAAVRVPDYLKAAIDQAAANIRRFHSSPVAGLPIETMPGVKCWKKAVAIQRVGLYIPGGTAPLISTVLMLGIPSQIAGCGEVVLCTPPSKEGTVNAALCYAALLCGIHKIYMAGGAQAIGAMAYGTRRIPRVSKIFGPGNQYVTCAKMLVNMEGIAIDMPAGPSELAVIADESAIPAFVAADLLSQAEHGPDSQVFLFATNRSIIEAVNTALEAQLSTLPRQDTARIALSHSKAIAGDRDQLISLVNAYAPEHLIIAAANAEALAGAVINAGSVFIGNFSPESAGDYASGTNHCLPTNGFARAYSGVSVESFMKNITFQQISHEGLRGLGPTVTALAEAEGLQAHANAITIRLNYQDQ